MLDNNTMSPLCSMDSWWAVQSDFTTVTTDNTQDPNSGRLLQILASQWGRNTGSFKFTLHIRAKDIMAMIVTS